MGLEGKVDKIGEYQRTHPRGFMARLCLEPGYALRTALSLSKDFPERKTNIAIAVEAELLKVGILAYTALYTYHHLIK